MRDFSKPGIKISVPGFLFWAVANDDRQLTQFASRRPTRTLDGAHQIEVGSGANALRLRLGRVRFQHLRRKMKHGQVERKEGAPRFRRCS